MNIENELTPSAGPAKQMGVVPTYDRITFPYTDLTPGVVNKKVAQDSLPSHRNSHNR